MKSKPCRYCTGPAIYGMCTFHIMLNSGAPLEYCHEVADSLTIHFYRCPHCDRLVSRHEFCGTCYDSVYAETLMSTAEETVGGLCPYCLSPKTKWGRMIRKFVPSDCLVCVQNYQRDRVPTHHTPEQLAAWVRDVQDSQEKISRKR